MEGQLLVLLSSGMAAVYSTMAAIEIWNHIVSSAVFWRHSLFVNYFPSGIFKHRILISTSQKLIESSSQTTKILLLNRQRIQQLIL
jgi:hypothetical protein